MRDRIATTIEVSVLDLSQIEKDGLDQFNKRRKEGQPQATAIRVHDTLGYVETPSGMFVLCGEGVGSTESVGNEPNELSVDLYGEFSMAGGTTAVSILPDYRVSLSLAEIRALPVKEKVNLAKFIRTFGRRLDINYEQWRKFLENHVRPLKKHKA